MTTHSFSIKQSLAFAWNKYSMRSVFVLGFLPLLLTVVATAIIALVFVTQHIVEIAPFPVNDHQFTVVHPVAFSLLITLGVLFLLFIAVGRVHVVKKINDAHEYSWKDLFVGSWREILFAFVLIACQSFVIGVGTVLLIVPGIIALVALYFSFYVLIDQKVSPFEAMKRSFKMTRHTMLHVFGWIVVYFVLSLFFSRTISVLSSIVFSPFAMVANFHIYRSLVAHHHTRVHTIEAK